MLHARNDSIEDFVYEALFRRNLVMTPIEYVKIIYAVFTGEPICFKHWTNLLILSM